MHQDAKLFVGFFRSNIPSVAIAKFLHSVCKRSTGIRVYTRVMAGDSTVKYCCVDFETERRAFHAGQLLGHVQFQGHVLLARPWVERTAANERRDVNWRTASWTGRERRRGERRRYSSADPYSTDSGIAAAAPLLPTSSSSSSSTLRHGPLMSKKGAGWGDG